jgi:hypothetical protein
LGGGGGSVLVAYKVTRSPHPKSYDLGFGSSGL